MWSGLDQGGGDVLAASLADAPEDEAETDEEERDPERHRALDPVLLRLALLLDAVFFLLELLLRQVFARLRLHDVAVGQVRLLEDLRARGEEVDVARHPVEEVLRLEDERRPDQLHVRAGDRGEELVAA